MNRSFLVIIFLAIGGCTLSPQKPVAEPAEEQGTPDLAIQAFIPPVIFAGTGDTIYISDLTSNIGDGRSAETIVRYFISDQPIIDVSTSIVIGERKLRSLATNESDESLEKPFVIPEELSQPPLFLAACVDIDDELDEIYEENNCTTNRSGMHQMPFDSGAVVPVGVTPITSQ